MLVDVEWLKERVDDERTVVFDCRFDLADKGAGIRSYLSGHIPGAYYLDLEKDLSSPVSIHGGRHPLPNLGDLADKLATAGVESGVTVVVYDAGEGMAPRAWWLIRHMGHEDVRVLDGGFNEWCHAGLPTSDELPAPRFRNFELRQRTEDTVTLPEVERLAAGEGDAVLLDARLVERFRGDVEPLDPAKGHIPGAVCAPWNECFQSPGVWKNANQLRDHFARVLSKKNRDVEAQIVAYCGSGVTACVNLFALEMAGFRFAKLYPGSFSDWASYPDHAVATGDGDGAAHAGS